LIAEFLPEAITELEEAYTFYEGRVPGLGADFKSEARHALGLVLQQPKAWTPIGGGLRQCRLNRFPYALVYGARKQRIIIIAVANLKRRPRYWRKRLRRKSRSE
jgi:ParE toxin of type II toxin-antitoxin system, parDE